MEPRQQRAREAPGPPDGPAEAGALRQSLVWAAQNRRRAALAVSAAAISVATLVASGDWAIRAIRDGTEVTLAEVFEALDSGAYAQAKEVANALRSRESASLDDIAGAVYVLGVATAMEAEETWSRDQPQKYLLAARYLEEARSRGLPPGRRGMGLYLLGKSLYKAGQVAASRPHLTAALEAAPQHQADAHRLLAGAYRYDTTPDLPNALHHITRYLEQRNLTPTQQHEGLIEQARILLAMDQPDQCMATLERVPANSPLRAEATVLRGQVQMHQARALMGQAGPSPDYIDGARKKYEEAINTLQLAQGHDTLSNHATRKAMYLIGVCFREIGDYRAALRQFTRTRQLFLDTPEAMAAGFEEAELSRDLGRDEEALAGYRRALQTLGDPRTFSNPWVSVRELQLRTLGAYEYYLKTRKFAVAMELAELLHPLFPEVRALELKADVHRGWGEALLAEADRQAPARAEPLRREGRRHFRQSGRIQARLAELLITSRRYPDLLWESGQDYMRGQSFAAAAGMMKEYLKDQARRRHPQALVMLGEAHLALGRVDDALEAFQECVDFHPRDAAAYQARLLASRAWREKGEPEQAEKLLLENLVGEYLTPASRQWRDSLFDLGELLYQEGQYEEAVRRLEEATLRYPDDARALPSRYLLAESYRRAAEEAREEHQENLAGSGRPASNQKIAQWLQKALDEFLALRDVLSERQQSQDLPAAEQAMLRNACFAMGDVEFARGRYAEAVEAYSNATNRYPNSPEVLDAYVQIANAYRRLGDAARARSALEQAKSVLDRMKPDTALLGPTNFDRAEWRELLEYLSDL